MGKMCGGLASAFSDRKNIENVMDGCFWNDLTRVRLRYVVYKDGGRLVGISSQHARCARGK